MSDKYKYIDKDSLYVYPDTDVLKNKAGITNYDELVLFESITVQKRLIELQNKPITIKKTSDLLKIHKHLFQDVYDWAGEPRKVEISKSGRQFLFTNSFDTAFNFIDSLLDEYTSIPKDDKNAISRKLAEILDNVNYGHFFREGNGRTQREFIRELAIQKGYSLDLNPMDDASVYERYMHGTTFGEIDGLRDLIFEILH